MKLSAVHEGRNLKGGHDRMAFVKRILGKPDCGSNVPKR